MPAPKGNQNAAKGRGLSGLSFSIPYEKLQLIKEYLALETGHEPNDNECILWYKGQANQAVDEILKRKLESTEVLIF